MNKVEYELLKRRDDGQAEILARFFRTGPGQYGEGDMFLGIKVPVTREVVRSLRGLLTFVNIDESLRSQYHEIRLGSLLYLVDMFRRSNDENQRKQCVDFYLSHTKWINNWELDDTFAIADILLYHEHDLIRKSVGWLLREAGKRDPERLKDFLETRAATLQRTALRYSLEKFSPEERRHFMKMGRRHSPTLL